MKRFLLALILLVPLALNAQTAQPKPGTTTRKPAAKPVAKAIVKPTAKPSATAGLQPSLERGKVLYAQHCLVCHQPDGGGVPNMNPPLIKTPQVLGDKSKLIQIVLKGLSEELEINGEIYSGTMPPLSQLTDQEIADVLTYVRNNFGNKASMITATEVKGVRGGIK